MGFAIEGKLWRPLRKPKDYKDKEGNLASVEDNAGTKDIYIEARLYLDSKQARKLGKWLTDAADYLDEVVK